MPLKGLSFLVIGEGFPAFQPRFILMILVCLSRFSGNAGGGKRGIPGIAINVTASEFYSSFASIFRLSDWSRISAPTREKTESLLYMKELMYMVGVHVNISASQVKKAPVIQNSTGHAGEDKEEGQKYPGDILQIC
jgi:hypothetical protein